MNGNIITFASNNVKGIQTWQNRIKLFEYRKSYVTTNGSVFLEDRFNVKSFFSHVKTNSYGVLVGY